MIKGLNLIISHLINIRNIKIYSGLCINLVRCPYMQQAVEIENKQKQNKICIYLFHKVEEEEVFVEVVVVVVVVVVVEVVV